ncbi:MAG TPA: hypothetical protein DCS09_11460 [Porphyromonadaceae bacterium]|nr:MAG: hypothetical protein A2071_06640 [Bacteroidetes bacterium GWC1_47_7]HAR39127.1 hypothetical protein [Porphyromonadaceae bacterium]
MPLVLPVLYSRYQNLWGARCWRYSLHILVGNAVDAMLQPVTEQFRDTAFNIIDNLIATLFLREITLETFYVPP